MVLAADVDICGAFLAGRRAPTLRAYSKDLVDFASFLGAARAAGALVARTAGRTDALALLDDAQIAGRAATIALRCAIGGGPGAVRASRGAMGARP